MGAAFCASSSCLRGTVKGVYTGATAYSLRRQSHPLSLVATSWAPLRVSTLRPSIELSSPAQRLSTVSSIQPPQSNIQNLHTDTRHVVDRLREAYDRLDTQQQQTPTRVADLIRTAFSFPLDQFQRDALEGLSGNSSVVLSAPTGAGKTVVGEAAVFLALCRRQKVFYTTPLKALSNQKFYDFKNLFGADRVGLVTGDITYNRDADILVMTTEIYRNMLYAETTEQPLPSGLLESTPNLTDSLFAVVFDEFHYLNDPDRGTVWEESVIHSPSHVLLVALSATMSNTADIRDWFSSVQGPSVLVQSNDRPVPLKFAFCDHEGVTPLFDEEKPENQKKKGFVKKTHRENRKDNGKPKLHPKLLRRLKESSRREERMSPRRSSRSSDDERESQIEKHRAIASKKERRSVFAEIPSFPFVVRSLRRRDMLPCIIFIFSRAGCDRAALAASHEKVELVTSDEEERIRERLDSFVEANPGMVSDERINLARKGIASHHAGMLPLWKICVEELFQDGLIKVVFATETLAAGINMPARTTVISSLSKRIGEEGFRALSTSEVLQMAGRAGRRGKDKIGHSLVLRSRQEGALDAFKILTSGVDALESKFTPTYGMVLNLLLARSLEDAKTLVDRSFGNFLREKQRKIQNSVGDAKSSSHDEDGLIKLIREKEALEGVMGEAEALLAKIDPEAMRLFVKSIERVKAERRALSYLVQQSTEVDSNLIEDTLTFAPTGTRLLLKEKKKASAGAEKRQKRRDYAAALDSAANGDVGAELRSFFLTPTGSELEEIEDEQTSQTLVEAVLLDLHNESSGVLPVFAAIDASGQLRLFTHNAVGRVLFEEDTIDIARIVSNWEDVALPARSKWQSIGFDQYVAPLPKELEVVCPLVASWRAEREAQGKTNESSPDGSIGGEVTGEVKAQRERVEYAKKLVREHELYNREDVLVLMAARRAINKIEAILAGTSDPYGTKRRKRRSRGHSEEAGRYDNLKLVGKLVDGESEGQSSEEGNVTDEFLSDNSSWDDFMALVRVLQHYGFVDEEHCVTRLGEIGAKVRSENELWTSLVLLEPQLERISPVNLAAVLGATQMEGGRNDVFVEHEISEVTRETVDGLVPSRVRLFAVQNEFNVGMTASLDADLMGLVELWATGVSWVELLSSTSLQEGDAIRILRRTLDVLRQTLHLPMVSEDLKRNSRRAIALLDRFPVTDDRTYVVSASEKGVIGENSSMDDVPFEE